MAEVKPIIADEVFTVKVDSNEEALVLTTYFNGGPITVLVDEGTEKAGEERKPPKVYTFNADPFFRRTNHYIASGNLSIRPGLGASSPKISITVSFPNMFPSDLQPTGGAKFSLRLFSPLASSPELVKIPNKNVDFGSTINVVLLIYS
jgi:hypothetical protein